MSVELIGTGGTSRTVLNELPALIGTELWKQPIMVELILGTSV
jgi:hypothetical protein